MDIFVLNDALLKYLSSGEKDSCSYGTYLLNQVLSTAKDLTSDEQVIFSSNPFLILKLLFIQVFNLTFINELSQGLLNLCFSSPWYAKLGFCHGVKFLLESFPRNWIVELSLQLFSSLLFVTQELCNEV